MTDRIAKATARHHQAIREWQRAKKRADEARDNLRKERQTKRPANEYHIEQDAEKRKRQAEIDAENAEHNKNRTAEELEEAIWQDEEQKQQNERSQP